jgi:hypothetical protein
LVARSHAVRTLVWGALSVRQLHPNKAIVLAGLDSDLFWTGVFPRPFPLVGVSDIYVAPDALSTIQPHPEWGRISDFVIPHGVLLDLLDRRRAVVYTPEAGRLRAVTLSYLANMRRQRLTLEEPRRVDVGQPSFARQLGPSWYELDSGHRWMARRATVRLRGPGSNADRLHLMGYCPASQVAQGPLRVSVGVDGRLLNTFQVAKGDAAFHLVSELPPELVGKPRIEVFVEVDRTSSPAPDRRELGLVFGTFEVRP